MESPPLINIVRWSKQKLRPIANLGEEVPTRVAFLGEKEPGFPFFDQKKVPGIPGAKNDLA